MINSSIDLNVKESHSSVKNVYIQVYIYIYIGLISLFNGIPNFVYYLIPKPCL